MASQQFRRSPSFLGVVIIRRVCSAQAALSPSTRAPSSNRRISRNQHRSFTRASLLCCSVPYSDVYLLQRHGHSDTNRPRRLLTLRPYPTHSCWAG
eukprot:576689-Pleurochrysis_carterae.AAC.1